MPRKALRSFRPVVDKDSRVLILGTMPGPVALARRQYYGFPGNHFWKIVPRLLGAEKELSYRQKIALLKENRIALWDTIRSCTRVGASDGSIRRAVPNDIAGLVRRYKGIHTIFLNGRMAEKLYRKHFGGRIHLPTRTLPSTSPAHASMPLARKMKHWSAILKCHENRNPWC